MNIILASSSPRRKDLLASLGLDFQIIPPTCDEKLNSEQFSYECIENLALQKALCVKSKTKNSVIISADTVVIFKKKILGKPTDFEDAFRMLKVLSGNTHFVVTAVALVFDNYQKIESSTTYVTFNNLTEKQITDYINKYKPFDKAGAYGIQELPNYFVKSYSDPLDNVIGLPCQLVQKLLFELKNRKSTFLN